MQPYMPVTDRETIASLVAVAVAQGAGHTAELLRAARDGEIVLATPHPRTPAPIRALRASMRPGIALIGDDVPGMPGLGPDGWLALRRLLLWADYGVLHAAGGGVAEYRLIIGLAQQFRRVLFVETNTQDFPLWVQKFGERKPRPLPFLAIVPIGGIHPVADVELSGMANA